MDVRKILFELKSHPKIGSFKRIADICEVSPPSLHNWSRVPAEYVRRLEASCDGAITRYDMRPDVFGHGPDDDPLREVG